MICRERRKQSIRSSTCFQLKRQRITFMKCFVVSSHSAICLVFSSYTYTPLWKFCVTMFRFSLSLFFFFFSFFFVNHNILGKHIHATYNLKWKPGEIRFTQICSVSNVRKPNRIFTMRYPPTFSAKRLLNSRCLAALLPRHLKFLLWSSWQPPLPMYC